MAYVFYEKLDEQVGRVNRTVFDESILTEEEKNEGIRFDFIPSPKFIKGKDSERRINLETNELFYHYFDVPLKDSERLEELEQTMAFLLLGGGF